MSKLKRELSLEEAHGLTSDELRAKIKEGYLPRIAGGALESRSAATDGSHAEQNAGPGFRAAFSHRNLERKIGLCFVSRVWPRSRSVFWV